MDSYPNSTLTPNQNQNSYSSNQNFQNELSLDNQPQSPEKKSNLGKILLIIFIVLIILGAGGYLVYKYYFIKNIAKSELSPSLTPSPIVETATVEGITEKLTVELPVDYVALSSEEAKAKKLTDTDISPTSVIYKNMDDLNNRRMFGLVFVEENKDNDYSIAFEKMKKVMEKLKSTDEISKDNQISEVNINNYRLLKHEGKVSETLALTEYFIFTNKSIFAIMRTNPVSELPYAQEDFQKMVNSFKISSK